jgi:hypothetical protein
MTMTPEGFYMQREAPLSVRVRYDHETVRGVVCIVINGAEDHTSCWIEDGTGPALITRVFHLEHAGRYEVAVVGEQQRSTVHRLVLAGGPDEIQ